MNLQKVKAAFEAWQIGELTGDYAAFKALLTDDFRVFSHPLMGLFSGEEALRTMQNLIAERESVPKHLTFSEPQFMTNEDSIVVQFTSKGTIQNGKFPYEGFNCIVFHINHEKLTGFQEYFGYIDPNWFKT